MRKVLIIDDNGAHRTLIRRALAKGGYSETVFEAESLAAAREKIFGEAAPALDIILLDLNLGDGRGSTLLPEIRSSQSYAQVPIIVLSTSGLESDRSECLALGASAYIIKSEDLSQFTSRLAAALQSLVPSA
jgi:DNA-binding response OmpR family regulator